MKQKVVRKFKSVTCFRLNFQFCSLEETSQINKSINSSREKLGLLKSFLQQILKISTLHPECN